MWHPCPELDLHLEWGDSAPRLLGHSGSLCRVLGTWLWPQSLSMSLPKSTGGISPPPPMPAGQPATVSYMLK